MSEPGYVTKAEAATLAGVDERTIERKARAGKITSKARPGFKTLYLLTDVEKLALTGRQEVRTGILTADRDVNTNGHGTLARPSADAGAIAHLLVAVLHAAREELLEESIGPTGPTVAPTGPTAAYVPKAEALAIAGVSDDQLRKAVKAGEVKVRGRRYRVTDLKAL